MLNEPKLNTAIDHLTPVLLRKARWDLAGLTGTRGLNASAKHIRASWGFFCFFFSPVRYLEAEDNLFLYKTKRQRDLKSPAG